MKPQIINTKPPQVVATKKPTKISTPATLLQTPLEKTLGKRTSTKLEKLSLKTTLDLLTLKPRKYYKKGELTPINQLQNNTYVTIQAKVISTNMKTMQSRKGYILQTTIGDGQNYLVATFFGKNPHILKLHKTNLEIGQTLLFSGTITNYNGIKQLVHPEYEKLQDLQHENLEEYVNKPIPIYPATNGMPSWKIKSCIQTLLEITDPQAFKTPIPETTLETEKIYTYHEALQKLHNPNTDEQVQKALHSLKYHESYMINLILEMKNLKQNLQPAYACEKTDNGYMQKTLKNLPYQLTNAQKKVIEEISNDLAEEKPMNRILLGDVGSGKTIVALLAMLQAIDNNKQAILLAPTEVLAVQHYENITKLLADDLHTICDKTSDNKIQVHLLTSSLQTKTKKQTLIKLASGQTGIYVGTHALLSEQVIVDNLALVVIDEQHRFGVEQRQQLLEKTVIKPHLLSMSATPIPRSLAVTLFGNLNISVIDEKPQGRKPSLTYLVNPEKTFMRNNMKTTWDERLWEKVFEETQQGNCVYVVVPKIGENDSQNPTSELSSISKIVEKLENMPLFENVKIQTLSSKTTPEDKEKIIENFTTGHAPILVSTTVIEVGVDVKKATMIVIMDAHRFGLATLHQLRGRVGRNDKESFCMLVTSLPEDHASYGKLEEFTKTDNGFKIAELDLQNRKEGDILGNKQSGKKTSLRFLELVKDNKLIEQVGEKVVELGVETMEKSLVEEMETIISYFYPQDESSFLFKS